MQEKKVNNENKKPNKFKQFFINLGLKIKKYFATDASFKIVLFLVVVVTLVISIVPILNVVSKSFSKAGTTVTILPRNLTLYNYQQVLKDVAFYKAFGVSVLTTTIGTAVSLVVLVLAAYPLSISDFPFRKTLMIFFIIVMLFSGGMIPKFLVMKGLHITNTISALIIPSLLNVFNLILLKNYFEAIPQELIEAAEIDGASNVQILFRVLIPCAVPVLITVGLYTAVGYWNNYFNALLYLPDATELYPLPMYILNLIKSDGMDDILGNTDLALAKNAIEAATIVLSMVPIVVVYPFLLKFLAKGTIVGSVKG